MSGLRDAKAPTPSTASSFDPEGAGYDMETARAGGMVPGDDGHWPSRDPRNGMLLKGRAHPTFDKAVEADEAFGHRLSKQGGRYYTINERSGI